MAIENADAGGGDWIPEQTYQELAEGQTLVVCKILNIEPGSLPKPTSRSQWFPVVVDMLALSGKFNGTVWRSERMTRTGMTNTLREKFHPDDAEKPMKQRRKIPRVEGTDLVCRFGYYTDNEGNRRLCLNAARPDDVKRVKALFEATNDDPYSAAEAKDRQLAMATIGDTAPGSGAPDDDDEPPF